MSGRLKRLIKRIFKLRDRHYRWMLRARLRERLSSEVHSEVFVSQTVERYSCPGRDGLRIVYVAPQYDYGNPARGLSYEENNFYHVLRHMGNEVVRFDFIDVLRSHGKQRMNHLLVETIYRSLPDIVFFVLFGDEIEPSTLTAIHHLQVGKTVNWFTDDHWRFDEFSSRWAPFFDWVVTTDRDSVRKYEEIGVRNVISSQWGCNHLLCRPLELPKRYDIVFVGQPYGERRAVLERLTRSGLDVRSWGYGTPGGRLTQLEMVRVFNQARIVLNLSSASVGGSSQIKGRHFEVPGCGAFLLTDPAPRLDEYYDLEKEMVVYRDERDLIEKIRYYLAHDAERVEVGARGLERTLSNHTYERRFEGIFAQMGLTSLREC